SQSRVLDWEPIRDPVRSLRRKAIVFYILGQVAEAVKMRVLWAVLLPAAFLASGAFNQSSSALWAQAAALAVDAKPADAKDKVKEDALPAAGEKADKALSPPPTAAKSGETGAAV